MEVFSASFHMQMYIRSQSLKSCIGKSSGARSHVNVGHMRSSTTWEAAAGCEQTTPAL